MNSFKKLRFPKTSLTLFIIGLLVLFAIPARLQLGASLNIPPNDVDFMGVIFPEFIFPIIIIGLISLLLTLALWLLLRKKGLRFVDLLNPLNTLGGIAIFVYLHFTLVA